METGNAQAAQPFEPPHSSQYNDREAAKNYAESRKRERKQQNERSGLSAAAFAYGRRNAILDLMLMRPGCDRTDDAELIAEMLVPFVVEAAMLHRHRGGSRRDPLAEAEKCLGLALTEWRTTRPNALAALVAQALAKREAAVEAHDPAKSRHVQWLPTMRELVAALRPTREESRHLRGWACIDPASPEERREADRLRKRAERAAKGATPREESLSARKPWEHLEVSRATWYRLKRQDQPETRETISSAPYPVGIYGPDGSVSALIAGNDNTALAAAA
ncbi:hypothetical protein [Heyndrickxia sporothermodurans]